MPYIINTEQNERDFKEPLSPATPRTSSRMGSTHSISKLSTFTPTTLPPPPYTRPTYGLMGSVGVVVTIIIFFLNMASDAFLIFAIWTQASSETNFYIRRKEKNIFKITLAIVTAPLIIINLLSFIWYTQNKHILGEHRLFLVKSKCQKFVCVLLHMFLLGSLVRYFDILHYGKRLRKYSLRQRAGSRGSLHRLRPYTEEKDQLSLNVVLRDTVILDLMSSFLKDAPQMVFQIFLFYRSSYSVLAKSDNLTIISQLVKLLVGLFFTSWSLVSYQDELHHSSFRKSHLPCGATVICLIWRACMAGARVIAIASFAALMVDGEGGLVKVYSDNAPMGLVLSFPSITALVIFGHWLLMIIWIHSQKTTFCNTENGSRSVLEFFYNVCMGWVGIFCYLNLKPTPSRRRMIFFYLLIFAENTTFMIVWYMQLITKPDWLRVTVVFSVEALFIMGISCAIGYFAFLHPSKDQSNDQPMETQSTWR